MKKSFTLIELIVTVGIVALLSVISFGFYYSYQARSGLDKGATDVFDLISNVKGMATASTDAAASHYLLILNTDSVPRSPVTGTTEGQSCDGLNTNEYCIIKIISPGEKIVPNFVGDERRVGLTKNILKLGNDMTLISDPLSNLDAEKSGTRGLFKLHFRTWDGLAGLNGRYWDANAGQCDEQPDGSCPPLEALPEEATLSLTQGSLNKTIRINLYSGVINKQ